ncbi:MAG: hypothetical protein M0D57_07200 [Sphingobacteriales bacterium JAD_PAG50586_3]|nr:MAG: hypothetical protein M0D57_07200 [Sphingobacteriales bacterium JAD_PAG50586_3]
MKRLLLLFAFLFSLHAFSQPGDNSFINQLKTENTGITATITFDGARFKVKDFEDNSGNIPKGATFKLLNTKMAKDDIGLFNVKIKIIDDNANGRYNGKIGYVYAASTSLTVDYTTGTIVTGKSKDRKDGKVVKTSKKATNKFLNRVATEKTGITGKVTFSPTASLKSTGFEDQTRVNEGSTFELLSTTMVKDNIDLYTIKIKIIDDNGNGKQNGTVGYMYGASTDLADYMDYVSGTIGRGYSAYKTSAKAYSGNFEDRLQTTSPKVFGRVTFSPNASLKSTGFDDATRVNEGATFELLSRKMIKDDISLYTIKIKIIDDNGNGQYNGKVGYMYPASTTITDYTDYTQEEVIGGPQTLKEVKIDYTAITGDAFLDRLSSINTGITGTVTFAPEAALKFSGFDDDTKVPEGATFELLNKKMVKDDIGLYTIKVKIIDDKATGKYNGFVGYIYGASTSLADNMDYAEAKIDIASPIVDDGDTDAGYSTIDSDNPPPQDMTPSEFIDRVPTENTNINGKVTFAPTASLKSTGFLDMARVNEGATFTLLNLKMVQDDYGLHTLKIKIIDDNGSGKYNGKVGYMYAASTSLSPYADYVNEVIDIDKDAYVNPSIDTDAGTVVTDDVPTDEPLAIPPPVVQPPDSGFLNLIQDQYTGLTGTITHDEISFKKTSFTDEEPRLKKGAVIELLSPEIIKDDKVQNLYYIKVLVVDDKGGGTFNKQIGYIYVGATSFSSFADYNKLEINITNLIDSQTNKQQTKKYLSLINTDKTGHTGTVTFEGGTLKTKSFSDVEPKLPKGTKIELFGTKMVKDSSSHGLYHIKVRVVDGPHKGKIGFMYPSSTSFSNYTDYKNNRIRTEDIK